MAPSGLGAAMRGSLNFYNQFPSGPMCQVAGSTHTADHPLLSASRSPDPTPGDDDMMTEEDLDAPTWPIYRKVYFRRKRSAKPHESGSSSTSLRSNLTGQACEFGGCIRSWFGTIAHRPLYHEPWATILPKFIRATALTITISDMWSSKTIRSN
jgi:hypothetical protein